MKEFIAEHFSIIIVVASIIPLLVLFILPTATSIPKPFKKKGKK